MLNPVEITKKITVKGIEKNNIAKAKEEFERLTRMAEMTARTIAFCEDVIGDNIKQAAEKGRKSTYLYLDGNYIIYGKEDKDGIATIFAKDAITSYANENIASYTSKCINIIPKVMIDYLRAHGYTVSTYEQEYHVYWVGVDYGTGLKISWEN